MYWISLTICIIIFLTKISCFSISIKRIVGERNTTTSEGKYIVQVQISDGICGGCIISETHILTAAHCVDGDQRTGKLLKPIRIQAYLDDVFDMEYSVIERNVTRVFQPAVYTWNFINDIAVLELMTPLDIVGNHLQKLKLPESLPSDTYPSYENALILMAEYGLSNLDIYTVENGTMLRASGHGELQVANAIVNDTKTCQQYYNDFRSDQLCVSAMEDESQQSPQGTCMGNSGSPAVYNNTVVIGVLSGSARITCNNNLVPSFFTRVSSFIPFIVRAMNGETDGLVVFDA